MNEAEKRKALGLKIQKLRRFNDLTQETLCGAIEIEPSNLSKIENGKNFPSLLTLLKLSEYFGIEPNELLDIEHLKDDKELEKEMFAIIKKLTSDKKQIVYRLIKFFAE